jgi:hypothetical protein
MFYQMKLTHAEALIQRIIEKSDDIKVGLDNTKVIMHHASLYMTFTFFKSEDNIYWDSYISYVWIPIYFIQ